MSEQPSQGARERTEKICGKIISEGRFGCFEFILHHITAAEQDAFQRGVSKGREFMEESVAFERGKEEGRREAAEIKEALAELVELKWLNDKHGSAYPPYVERKAVAWQRAKKALGLSTDPPTQPAATEPEKRPPLTKEIATAIWANLEPGSRIQEGMAILTDYVLDLQQRVKRLEEKE